MYNNIIYLSILSSLHLCILFSLHKCIPMFYVEHHYFLKVLYSTPFLFKKKRISDLYNNIPQDSAEKRILRYLTMEFFSFNVSDRFLHIIIIHKKTKVVNRKIYKIVYLFHYISVLF